MAQQFRLVKYYNLPRYMEYNGIYTLNILWNIKWNISPIYPRKHLDPHHHGLQLGGSGLRFTVGKVIGVPSNPQHGSFVVGRLPIWGNGDPDIDSASSKPSLPIHKLQTPPEPRMVSFQEETR
jgi:hypothetical protein